MENGITVMAHICFAQIAPGLETALADELSELGIRGRVEPGGVEFSADDRQLAEVHLWTRLAGRILLRVVSGSAANLDDLAATVRRGAWGAFIHPRQIVEVQATTRSSKLQHRQTIERKVQHAITDAMRGPRVSRGRPPREVQKIFVRILKDKVEISADASGELLHRRGWRKNTARAPIRENLAAAVLRVAQWDPGEPLVDPMCGSGTFAIEAAGTDGVHAPGLGRTFAFESWPSAKAPALKAIRKKASGERRAGRTLILAADRDPAAMAAAGLNARRAGVDGRIIFRETPFHELEPIDGPGLVVINPPYGRRVGGGGATRIYQGIGRRLREAWPGWRVAVLVPDRRKIELLDLPVEELTTFSNGGIKVHLVAGIVPE